MKIKFCIRDKGIYDIIKNLFDDQPNITVNLKSITDYSFQTIILACNLYFNYMCCINK
jgi:hypothetical protein